MRVANYVRVSTEEQVKHGFSLPEQRRTLREHAERMGWEVADEGDSGANPNRAGILRILELAEAGRIDAALAWKRDRLFRDLYHRRGFEADLAEYGVRLVSLNDTGSRIGDGVTDLLSEQERQDLADRVRNGRRGKAHEGKLPGGTRVSFGFKRNADKTNFEVDPDTVPHVHRIFEAVGAHGRSLTSVCNEFMDEGIRTPGGSLRWACSTIRRVIQNEIYLSRTYEEVAALVEPDVARALDPDRSYGIQWVGQYQASRVYVGSKAFRVVPQDRESWIAVPVPDAGVPPEWVHAARERVAGNQRYQPSTDPRITLRGFIKCECGRSMTSYQSRGNRYYACRAHRSRHEHCENTRFHRLDHVEGRVQEFVLGMLRDPETFRGRVEEQAADMRRSLSAGESVVRALRKELDELDRREDNLVEAIASLGLGTRLTEKFREELERIGDEREGVQARLEEVSDVEEQARRLRELPLLVEEYLADLPDLIGRMPQIREYETVPAERTPENPLGIYQATPERIRHKDESELDAERREAQEARSQRFREVYSALGLTAVVYRDRSLEIRWGGGCSEWHKGTSGCCIA